MCMMRKLVYLFLFAVFVVFLSSCGSIDYSQKIKEALSAPVSVEASCEGCVFITDIYPDKTIFSFTSPASLSGLMVTEENGIYSADYNGVETQIKANAISKAVLLAEAVRAVVPCDSYVARTQDGERQFLFESTVICTSGDSTITKIITEVNGVGYTFDISSVARITN